MRKSKLHFWIFFFFILSLFSTVSQAKIDCSIDEAAHQAIEETKARFTELFGELQLTIESGDSHGATSIPRSGDGAYSYQSNAYNDVVVSPQAHTILPPPSVSAQKISRGGFVSIDDSKFAKDQQGYFPMPAVEVVMPDYSKPLKDMYHDTGLFRPAGDNSSYALPLMKDSSGRYLDKPVPAGHKEDVYYTGDKPEVHKVPKEYGNASPKEINKAISNAKRKKTVKKIRFNRFDANSEGYLTEAGINQAYQYALGKLGLTEEDLASQGQILGQGTFSMAFKICPKNKTCVAVKVLKANPGGVSESLRLLFLAQDSYLEDIFNAAMERATYKGKRLIRLLKKQNRELLEEGIVVMELAKWEPKGQFLAFVSKYLTPQENHGGKTIKELLLRKSFMELGSEESLQKFVAHKISDGRGDVDMSFIKKKWSTFKNQPHFIKYAQDFEQEQLKIKKKLEYFFDYMASPHLTGPEVIKIVETLKLCKEMSSYPFVSLSMPASVCAKWKSAYKIPDDFMQRVYSLEQSYRDSAAAVIRHRRAHFPDPRLIRGNAAVDGNPREIGLDYLQGENAVWLPDEQIFGSHDI